MESPELTPLAAALRANDADAVATLLTQHPELTRTLNDAVPGEAFGTTALLVAVRHANRAMIDTLLTAGADITQRSHWWAGGFGVLDDADAADWLADYLIERGARLDPTTAAKLNRFDDLKALVAADPSSVRAGGGDGQTALHRARTVEMAAWLLDHGAELDVRDVDHESTPAQYLVRDRPDVARYLVSRGCRTDILMATALGDRGLVSRHLARDAAVIRTSVDGKWFPMQNLRAGGTIYTWTLGGRKTAHILAREFGHLEIEEILWGASDPSLTLAMACELGDDERVQALVATQSDLPRRLDDADAVRIVAATELGKGAAVQRMLAIGWPAGVTDTGNVTALHWAGFHGDASTADALIAAGARLDVRDAHWSATPLGWALWGSANGWRRATGDYAGTVRAMLDAGAVAPKIDEHLVASDAVRLLLIQSA
jgi:ankyrin repeat protein